VKVPDVMTIKDALRKIEFARSGSYWEPSSAPSLSQSGTEI